MVNKRKIILTVALILLAFAINLGVGFNKSSQRVVNTTSKEVLEEIKPKVQLVSTSYESPTIKVANNRKAYIPIKTSKKISHNPVQKAEPKTSTYRLPISKANASKYVKLASFEPVLKGTNCNNGGYRIDEGYDVNKNEKLDLEEIVTTKFVCEDFVAEKLASINPKKRDFFKVDVLSDLNHNGKIDGSESNKK